MAHFQIFQNRYRDWETKNADEAKVLALQSKKERFVGGNSKIPTAPFVTDTNAWTKLGLKVALKEAVTQGAKIQ